MGADYDVNAVRKDFACLSEGPGAPIYFDNACVTLKPRQVVAAIVSLTLLLSVVQPLNAAVFVFDGIFIGANDVAYMFRAMMVSALGFFAPAALVFVLLLGWGLKGAWVAYITLMVGRLVTLWARYRRDLWLQSFVS